MTTLRVIYARLLLRAGSRAQMSLVSYTTLACAAGRRQQSIDSAAA